jgi:uncharacterized membrane protein YqgA involved in biofilm formation
MDIRDSPVDVYSSVVGVVMGKVIDLDERRQKKEYKELAQKIREKRPDDSIFENFTNNFMDILCAIDRKPPDWWK